MMMMIIYEIGAESNEIGAIGESGAEEAKRSCPPGPQFWVTVYANLLG